MYVGTRAQACTHTAMHACTTQGKKFSFIDYFLFPRDKINYDLLYFCYALLCINV